MSQVARTELPKESFSVNIGDTLTEFVVIEFVDHVMVIATQIGRLGTLLQARQDAPSQTFSVDVLLGKRNEPLLEICGRQLIEKLALAGCNKNLLLWLGMVDISQSVTKDIINILTARRPWKKT